MTSVSVYLHNETDYPLALTDAPEPHGDWTGSPPSRVAPHDVALFGTESANFTVGTEGRATYQIGDDPGATVYIHWDNPKVGGNSYHTNADEAHYSFWTARGETDSTVHFVVRPAQTVATDFLPSRDGFRFGNSFGEVPYTLPMLRDTPLNQKYGNAKSGLCGGMVFAALDYFLAGQRIPQQPMAPPGEEDELFLFLVDRLFASFNPLTILRLLGLMSMGATDGDGSVLSRLGVAATRASVMAFEEWPRVRADIDAGRPSPICLQTIKSNWPGDMGANHQVLVYAYEAHGHSVTLRIYDPNTPPDSAKPGVEDAVFMRFQDGDVSDRIVVEHNIDVFEDDDDGDADVGGEDNGVRRPIYCFVRMEYSSATPRLATQPRIGGVDVEQRRLSVVVSAPQLVESQQSATGRQEFDVIPDCGSAEFECALVRENWRWDVSFTPVGFYQPVIEWTLGGTTVPDGGLTDVTLAPRPVFQTGAPTGDPPVLGRARTETRSLTMRTVLSGGSLEVWSRGDSGNFTVPLRVTCREADGSGPGPWSRDFSLEVQGWHVKVEGLGEANGQCLQNYINARRNGPPDAQGLADLITARLSPRPHDPIWDPNPDVWTAITAVLAADPRTLELNQEAARLREAAEVMSHSASAPAAPTAHETPALTDEQLQRDLREQLAKEIGGFRGPV